MCCEPPSILLATVSSAVCIQASPVIETARSAFHFWPSSASVNL